MNTTARRIVTTLAGVGLAASAFAATGPAADAGKPGGGSDPAAPPSTPTPTGLPRPGASTMRSTTAAPVSREDIKSITCTFDGVAAHVRAVYVRRVPRRRRRAIGTTNLPVRPGTSSTPSR